MKKQWKRAYGLWTTNTILGGDVLFSLQTSIEQNMYLE